MEEFGSAGLESICLWLPYSSTIFLESNIRVWYSLFPLAPLFSWMNLDLINTYSLGHALMLYSPAFGMTWSKPHFTQVKNKTCLWLKNSVLQLPTLGILGFGILTVPKWPASMILSVLWWFCPNETWLSFLWLTGLRKEALCGLADMETFAGQANRVQFVTHWAKLSEQHVGSGTNWPTVHHTMPYVLL